MKSIKFYIDRRFKKRLTARGCQEKYLSSHIHLNYLFGIQLAQLNIATSYLVESSRLGVDQEKEADRLIGIQPHKAGGSIFRDEIGRKTVRAWVALYEARLRHWNGVSRYEN